MLEINREISGMDKVAKEAKYPWWSPYFLFTKKSFEILHYVFNWVEESQNIVTADFQFIRYLFCLIPIDEAYIFIECTTILEDLLTIKTKSMLDLKGCRFLFWSKNVRLKTFQKIQNFVQKFFFSIFFRKFFEKFLEKYFLS